MSGNEGEPLRYTLPMKREFGAKYTRDQMIGVPIRERLGDDVMIQGIVVDWIDRDDHIDLVIEVRPAA